MKKLIKRLFRKSQEQPKHTAYAVMFFNGARDYISGDPFFTIEEAEEAEKKALKLRSVRSTQIVTILSKKPIAFFTHGE